MRFFKIIYTIFKLKFERKPKLKENFEFKIALKLCPSKQYCQKSKECERCIQSILKEIDKETKDDYLKE